MPVLQPPLKAFARVVQRYDVAHSCTTRPDGRSLQRTTPRRARSVVAAADQSCYRRSLYRTGGLGRVRLHCRGVIRLGAQSRLGARCQGVQGVGPRDADWGNPRQGASGVRLPRGADWEQSAPRLQRTLAQKAPFVRVAQRNGSRASPAVCDEGLAASSLGRDWRPGANQPATTRTAGGTSPRPSGQRGRCLAPRSFDCLAAERGLVPARVDPDLLDGTSLVTIFSTSLVTTLSTSTIWVSPQAARTDASAAPAPPATPMRSICRRPTSFEFMAWPSPVVGRSARLMVRWGTSPLNPDACHRVEGVSTAKASSERTARPWRPSEPCKPLEPSRAL